MFSGESDLPFPTMGHRKRFMFSKKRTARIHLPSANSTILFSYIRQTALFRQLRDQSRRYGWLLRFRTSLRDAASTSDIRFSRGNATRRSRRELRGVRGRDETGFIAAIACGKSRAGAQSHRQRWNNVFHVFHIFTFLSDAI